MSSENFPAGMRVLVVDDDPLCLMILERMLRQCSYTVTTCSRAATALSLLRENRDKFDLVISDVYMPDMDGFKLLELIGLELDLPVIMMSANGETSAVMKGITHGACDYLLKPVRIEELRNIWQHVVRKSRRETQREDPSGDWDENSRPNEEGLTSGDLNSRKRKEKPEAFSLEEHIDDANSLKRARVVWSIELHQQFVNAVNQLGIDKAVPKRILEIMNVQGLTRENVASHLQKYRLYLKRLSGVTPQPHPVAAFQPNPTAAEGKGFGGTMTVIPGGRGAAAISKPVSLPLSSPTSNSSPPALPPIPSSSPSPSNALLQNIFPSFSRGPLANIDAPTLATLAQLQALQKHAGGGGNGLNANMLNSGVNQNVNNGSQMNLPLNPNLDIPGGIPGLSGLSALDLNLLMQQTQQDSMGRQRLRALNGDSNLNAFQGNLSGLSNLHMRMGLSGNNGGGNGNGNGNLNGGMHNSPLLPIPPNSNSSGLGDVELGSMGKPPSLSLMTALGVSDRGNNAPTLQLGNNANSNANNNNNNGEFQGNGSVNLNSNGGGANGMNQEGGLASFTELTGEDYLNNIGGNGGGGNELSSAFISQLMGNGRNGPSSGAQLFPSSRTPGGPRSFPSSHLA